MLQVNKATLSAADASEAGRTPKLTDGLTLAMAFVRRQSRVLLLAIACMTVLGLFYLYMTPPSFTASGTMVIDTRKVQLFQQQSVLGDIAIDAGTVQTQIEILKSRNISQAVIKSLGLIDDPEFVGSGGGLMRKLLPGLLGQPAPLTEQQRIDIALAAFESRRTITRIGLTYVMEIGFRSLNAEKSARIVNAIADAYVTDQLEAKYEATRRASIWLRERINEMRMQVSSAERAVVDFKRTHNIVQSLNGQLLNEQQVSEVNTQLILARAAKAEAKAKLDRIQQVMKQDLPDASVTDALHSEVIIKLRNQYLEFAAKERVFAERYGPNHLATLNLRTQMLELRHNIEDEMKKIAESYRSDYEIADTREQNLTTSLAGAVSDSQSTNQAQIQLRELDSNAQSARSVYDSFLQRYMESVQQQSFPISEARMISTAIVPLSKSSPSLVLTLAATTMAGGLLGFGIALFREFSDRVFRTPAQIEDVLGANCIATLPGLKLANAASNASMSVSHPDRKAAPPRTLTANGLLRYVVESPFSQYTEGLRALKVVVDLNGVLKSNKVIGMTSTLPNEGKSTVASNFAQLIAHAGQRVILIDSDLRNPSLSHHLAPNAALGLVDVIAGKADLSDAVWTDPVTGLLFLPAGRTDKLLHTNRIMASDTLQSFISRQRDIFDFVILDFPPLAPVVDTRATTNFVDSYIYVVEWGGTKRDLAETVLGGAPEVYDRLLGVLLNKVNMAQMSRYEGHASPFKYRKHYARYGYVD